MNNVDYELKIRLAVPSDEDKIRALFLEMLRTICGTEQVEGYPDGYLDRFWAGGEDRIYVAEDGDVVAFLSVEVHDDVNCKPHVLAQRITGSAKAAGGMVMAY